jgi:16S rRNA (cytosine1402-N4)-methyltransferase
METPERGFSFAADGPLDMRMDRSQGPTAADLLERMDEEELADTLRQFGEERAARRIARALVRRRRQGPLRTTLQLARAVEEAVGGRRGGRLHPATRTFQALRIAVNRELEGLDDFVRDACRLLVPGGRAAFIAFHSLEDRAVKQTLVSLTARCVCPPGLPLCACGRPGIVERVTGKAVRPREAEILLNPRSRSARLRVVRRLPESPGATEARP